MQKEEERSIKRSTKLPMPCTAVLLIAIAMAVTSLAVVPGIASSVAAAQEVEVKVTLESGYAEEGETFFATIDVDSITDLNTAKFDLSFDKSVIEVRDVEEGEINSEKMPIMWNVNPDKDTVRVIINMPVEESVSGTGYLAKIEFKVKGKEGEKSELNISNGKLGKYLKGDTWTPEEIPANWIDAEIIIGVEEEDEEEDEEGVGEEVIPGSPNITVWEPAEAVVSNAVGESRTFNVTINQIADISWQINGTEVQRNESVTEAIFTNASAVIGTRNVSAIAINTTTGLSDMHAWIWNVTLTPTATVTPTPTLAPGETPTPASETGIEETPKPQGKKTTPKEKPTPVPVAPPTPTPKPPGFEAILAIGGMLTIAYILLRRR